MNTSNDPAAADNNRHHTDGFRSQADNLEQFAPDMTSDPHLIMTTEELERMNAKLESDMHKPIDWDKGLE